MSDNIKIEAHYGVLTVRPSQMSYVIEGDSGGGSHFSSAASDLALILGGTFLGGAVGWAAGALAVVLLRAATSS